MDSKTKIIIGAMNYYHKPIFSLLVFICLTGFLFAQSNLSLSCSNYENFENGTVFGVSAGDRPGDLLPNIDIFRLSLKEFDQGANAAPLFGDALIRSEVDQTVNLELINGKHLLLEQISVLYEVKENVDLRGKICFNYWNRGGLLNLEVNGGGLIVSNNLQELDGQEVAPGVFIEVERVPTNLNATTAGRVCFNGAVHSLLIGGMNALIGGPCHSLEGVIQECRISDLRVKARPCNADGQFFVDIDFAASNPGGRGFSVKGNGRDYGTFNYDEDVVTIGPLPGNGETAYEFVVIDNENPDCRAAVALGRVDCRYDCGLEGVTAYVQNCIPTFAPQLIIDLAFRPDLLSQKFDLYLNGEFWAYYSYSDLPLVLNNFPQTDFLRISVCENDLPQCCVSTEVQYPACPQQSCIDFNELETGTVWGRDANHQPGDEVYEKDGIKATVEPFHYFDGTSDFWNVKVEEGIFGLNFPQLQGKELFISNINLQFDFSAVEGGVDGLCFDFVDGGGEENFAVNGEPIKVLRSLYELQDREIAPGVWASIEPNNTASLQAGRLCLKGQIKSLLIGGQEFAFDNLCYRAGGLNDDCGISNLVVAPRPCTPNGIFYADFKFEVVDPASDFYIVFINGRPLGRFAYSEDFPPLGPFPGDHNERYLIEVQDGENARCRDQFILEPLRCNPECGLDDLQATIKSCNDDGSYNLRIDLDHANSRQVGFDLFIEGQFFSFYRYDQLPVIIEGFSPTTDGLELEIKACENDNANCCSSAIIDLRNPCPEQECIEFEDWPAESWGMDHGQLPGGGVFENDRYKVSIFTFQGIDWSNSFDELSIKTDNTDDWGGQGRYLHFDHISAIFNFTPYPGGVQMLTFDYRQERGAVNIGVNGGNIHVLYERPPGVYPLGSGVIMEVQSDPNNPSAGKVVLKGNIHTLLLGGAALDVDNFCVNQPPVCNIYNLSAEATPCTDDGQYYIELDFDHAQTSGEFVLWMNDNEVSTHAYDELPLKLGPFPAPLEESLAIKVKDRRSQTCYAETSLGPVFCGGCQIFNLAKEIFCHPEEATYDLLLKFEYQNTSSAGFNVWVDGEKYGPFQYENLPIKIEGLPWTEQANHKLLICDLSTSVVASCCLETEFQIECQPPNCEIGEIQTELSDCDDGHFEVEIDFEYAQTSEQFYISASSSDVVFGPFEYAALPLIVGPIPAVAGQEVVLTVWDKLDENCARRKSLGVVDCPPPNCRLFDLEFSEVECDIADRTASMQVYFDHQDAASDFFIVRTNNGWEEKFKYIDLPVNLNNIPIPDDNNLSLKICDAERDDCCLDFSLALPCPPPDCEIGALRTDVGDCQNGEFKLKLDFEYAHTGEKFWVTFNTTDQAFGPYKYENLPIEIGPIAGSMEETIIEVRDERRPNCGRRKSLGLIHCPPECKLHSLESSLDCDPATNTFDIKINFEFENTNSEHYILTLENGRQARFKYVDLPLILEDIPYPLDRDKFSFSICDAESEACCLRGEIEIPCAVEDCEIGELQLEPTECDSDGQYMVDIKFRHARTGEVYKLYVDDEFFGRFRYDELPLRVGPFAGNREATRRFQIVDESENCKSEATLEAVDCNESCHITQVIAELRDCEDGAYLVDLEVRTTNPGPLGYYIFADGGISGPYRYGNTPVTIGPFAGDGESVVDILVLDIADPSCFAYQEIGPIDCDAICVIENIEVEAQTCQADGDFVVDLEVEATNPGDRGFSVYVNGDLEGDDFSYDESYVTIGPLAGDGETIYEIAVVDNRYPTCSGLKLLGPVSCQMENVWPGDANSDNIVQHFDLLPIGLAFGEQGPLRAQAEDRATVWEGVFALPWAKDFANGLNYKHADCNGDGVVNEYDVEAIRQNYGRNHGPPLAAVDLPTTDTDPIILVDVPAAGDLQNGASFRIPIILGEENNPVEDIYGVAYSIDFDPRFIDPTSLRIEYPVSWLGGEGVNMITLDRVFADEGRIDVAMTRIDQNEVSGFGPIGFLHGIIDDIAGAAEAQIEVQGVLAIDLIQNPVPIRLEPPAILRLNPDILPPDVRSLIYIYPNPTQDWINIVNNRQLEVEALDIFNAHGQRVLAGLQLENGRLSLGKLGAGVYFLRMKIGGVIVHEKIIKE